MEDLMKNSNPATPQESPRPPGGFTKFPLSKKKMNFHLRLAFLVLPAFFILLFNLPYATGSAHLPEWRSFRVKQKDSMVFYPAGIAELAEGDIYLPFLAKEFPFTPTAPVLNTISNDDGDGSYTVSWSPVTGAEIYLLQEDDNSAFTSPTTAYQGPGTSTAISGKELGNYYYRVMASNDYASSEWSNPQSVVVSVSAPPCPQTGSWLGNTSQGYSFSFAVEDSPQCQIAGGSLSISFLTTCGYVTVQTGPTISFPITNNTFSTGVIADKVRIQGDFTSSSTAEGTFSVNYGTSCQTFGTWEAYPVSGADGPVNAIAVQANDAKILIGGDFSEVGGQPHNNIARLNPDGSLDAAFNPSFDEEVFTLAVQNDGKILVGGDFSQVNGQAHAGIARLNRDGSLDTSFDTQIDGTVYALALQSTGKILVGGYFSYIDEEYHRNFARLNSDGSLDTAFTRDESFLIDTVVVQPDDKIWLGGNATFVRLNPDGDLNFDTGYDWAGTIALQLDLKIVASVPAGIVRFNPDGSLDGSFDGPEPNGNVPALALLSDGRIIVGGDFTQLDTLSIKYLAQLNLDGFLNPAFTPEPSSEIYALAIQPDDKILVGGAFSIINGQVRHSIVRLNPDGSLDESFSIGP
jgi:uncharacterized delta-60 repeat protein